MNITSTLIYHIDIIIRAKHVLLHDCYMITHIHVRIFTLKSLCYARKSGNYTRYGGKVVA